MALDANMIFKTLLEWQKRPCGSENEMMARETMMMHLEGVQGIDMVEEALFAPTGTNVFLAVVTLAQIITVFLSPSAPYIVFFVGLLFWANHLLYMDGRRTPLTWLLPKVVSANLSVKKGQGRKLFILMAHLDTADVSYARRTEVSQHAKGFLYTNITITGLGVLVPAMFMAGYVVPWWLLTVVIMFMVTNYILNCIDGWRHGSSPGVNANLTGVTAATEAASRLWDTLPPNSEVRLVLTSAKEAGLYGAHHYMMLHEEALKDPSLYDSVMLLNLDTVGAQSLNIVRRSGQLTQVQHGRRLYEKASLLCKQNEAFKSVGLCAQEGRLFESVVFERAGIDSLTLSSIDPEGNIPSHIGRETDTEEHVSVESVKLAARFIEALVRLS